MRVYAGRQFVPFFMMVFGMNRPRGELTTYRVRGGHATDWANNREESWAKIVSSDSAFTRFATIHPDCLMFVVHNTIFTLTCTRHDKNGVWSNRVESWAKFVSTESAFKGRLYMSIAYTISMDLFTSLLNIHNFINQYGVHLFETISNQSRMELELGR